MSIVYNSPEHQKERANVVPLSLTDASILVNLLNKYIPEGAKSTQLLAQQLIWDYENLRHMRETAPVWISVNDRLPDNSEPVFAWDGKNIIRCFLGTVNIFYSVRHSNLIKSTHWMPLPQPPTK